jgi:predicted site-specific integrase-resolvase
MKTRSPLFLSIGETAKRLGVSIPTLRLWDAAGSFIPELRTEGGQRRYSVEQVSAKTGEVKSAPTIGYCRVSSAKQAEDLERQKAIVAVACAEYGAFEIISDIGSGMNYNKSGLRDLLDRIAEGTICRLVIADKDRLLRFGAELIFAMCANKGVPVLILNQNPNASFEEDLAKDVLEIVTVFSARLYGSRSKRNKTLLANLQKAAKSEE